MMMAAIDRGGGRRMVGCIRQMLVMVIEKKWWVHKKRSQNYKMKYIFACSINRQTVKQTELKWREVM